MKLMNEISKCVTLGRSHTKDENYNNKEKSY